jgi:hypothetical protein
LDAKTERYTYSTISLRKGTLKGIMVGYQKQGRAVEGTLWWKRKKKRRGEIEVMHFN